jgi:hypothetical protein
VTPKNKSIAIAVVLMLGLFFSRPFIYLTPLPLVYFLFRQGRSSLSSAVLPAFAIVTVTYTLGFGPITALYTKYPSLLWLLPIPMMEFASFLPQSTIAIIGIFYFTLFLWVGVTIHAALASPQNTYRIVLWSLILTVTLCGIIMLVLIFPHAQTVMTSLQDYLAKGLEEFMTAQRESGLALEDIMDLKSNLSEHLSDAIYIMPFAFFLSLTFLFVLNLIMAKRFFTGFFNQLTQINFTVFAMPFFTVWLVVALIAFLLANKLILNHKILFFANVNVLLVMATLYFFQGLAIIFYLMDKWQILGFLRFAFLIFLMIILSVEMRFTSLAIVGLGFFDAWLDLRKIHVPPKKPSVQN